MNGWKSFGVFLAVVGFLIFILGLTDADRTGAAILVVAGGSLQIAGAVIIGRARKSETYVD
ncbi:MAG: hypothetical protein L3K02_08135 [Thermoplasmata archaeon]|nr:hypothetical protein [Thermoplasmata archaeon]